MLVYVASGNVASGQTLLLVGRKGSTSMLNQVLVLVITLEFLIVGRGYT